LAPHPPQLPLRQADELAAVEADAAADGCAGGRGESEHRERCHRLAGAALPDEPDDLRRFEVERVDRHDAAVSEANVEVAQLELHRRATRRGSRRSRSPSPTRLKASAVI